MIQQYPSQLLQKAVEEFAKLPGIGRKTALRLVLHLLRREPEEVERFARHCLDPRALTAAYVGSRLDTDIIDLMRN